MRKIVWVVIALAALFDFYIPNESELELKLYDILGHRLRQLSVSDAVGVVSLRWDGKDTDGNELPSGIYIYRARVGEKTISGRISLTR